MKSIEVSRLLSFSSLRETYLETSQEMVGRRLDPKRLRFVVDPHQALRQGINTMMTCQRKCAKLLLVIRVGLSHLLGGYTKKGERLSKEGKKA